MLLGGHPTRTRRFGGGVGAGWGVRRLLRRRLPGLSMQSVCSKTVHLSRNSVLATRNADTHTNYTYIQGHENICSEEEIFTLFAVT